MDNVYKIRTIFVYFAFLALYLTIIFNLFIIQIKHTNFFANLGEKQYTITITQTPSRAPIFDRHGNTLATNKESLAAFTLPRAMINKKATQNFLHKFFPDAYKRFNQAQDKHFIYIKRKLMEHEIELINKHSLEDIKILSEPNRFYPLEAASTLVGITDIDNNGLCGIELTKNKYLAGIPSKFTLKKDARLNYFTIEKTTNVPGAQGEPITLTIDGTLQFLALEELKETIEQFHAEDGGVIIMDPKSGEILAMTTYPSFDPNNTTNLDIETMKNRCIANVYEFGSVMKVFAAMAALEENLVTIDEIIDCENANTTIIDGIRVNTSHPHSVIPFGEVIEKSNNIGIAKVALRLGNRLYEHYLRVGFGKKTGISLPGEQSGFINSPKTWSRKSIFSLSYGYEISSTLLQLACAFSLIANGGYLVKPIIVIDSKLNTIPPLICPIQLYKTSTIKEIRSILEKTVLHGTAWRAKLNDYNIMGKTGTANLLNDGVYDHTRDIYTFAGIIEKDNYQRVIVTYVKNVPDNKHLFAAHVVAPLFRKIAEKMIIHDKVL